MTKVLFLTSVMKKGHGVSLVIHELTKSLAHHSIEMTVGAIDVDQSEYSSYTVKVDGNLNSVTQLAGTCEAEVLVAVTSPFFEMLPALSGEFKTIAYEHGDPSSEFFTVDKDERKRIAKHKTENVYPFINSTVAISEFIKNDINCNSAKIIYNGVDHVIDLGVKASIDFKNPLKIGTLMRIGSGEARYKGNALFIELASSLMALGNFEFHVMGKGNEADAKEFATNGMHVHLNASDSERDEYLRDLDIFISPSLWEGFNLPLAEAEALGTLALAFDTGAHPEVTPFIYGSKAEMVQNILNWNSDRELLLSDSHKCYEFVRSRFKWSYAGEKFADEITFVKNQKNISNQSKGRIYYSLRNSSRVSQARRGLRYLKHNSIFKTLAKLIKTMRNR